MPRLPDPKRMELLDEDTLRMLRSKTPAERVAMALDAHRLMRQLIEARVRMNHPEWDDQQVRAEINRRLLGGSEAELLREFHQ